MPRVFVAPATAPAYPFGYDIDKLSLRRHASSPFHFLAETIFCFFLCVFARLLFFWFSGNCRDELIFYARYGSNHHFRPYVAGVSHCATKNHGDSQRANFGCTKSL